jgi:EmrB/QacA subfamily drug resistance transporter
MSVLDATIVNVALPAVRRSLALDVIDLQWVINAYLLTFGGLLLLGGRLGDHFGRKRIYMIGAIVFSLASFVGGIAPSGATLIAARAVQGIGAALLTPGTLSLLTSAYPEARARTRAIGVWSASAGSAASAGVLLGGVLTDTLGWRWVFFVNIPLGVAVLVLGGLALVESREHDERGKRLDVPGALLITAAMTLLVYAVVNTDRYAWGSWRTLVPLDASVVLLLVFVVFEAYASEPLIPLGVLRRRTVVVGVLTVSLFGLMLTSSYYFLSLFLQGPHRLSALNAGLAFLPTTVTSVLSSASGSRLCARFGPRRPLAGALVCATLGTFWLSRFGAHSDLVTSVLLPSALFGVGTGLCFVCVTVLVTSAVEGSRAGLASGLLNAGRQIGGSIGLAALSVIAATHARALLAVRPGAVAEANAGGYGRALLVAAFVGLVALAVVVVRGAPSAAEAAFSSVDTAAASVVVAPGPVAAVRPAVASSASGAVKSAPARIERSQRALALAAFAGAAAFAVMLARALGRRR